MSEIDSKTQLVVLDGPGKNALSVRLMDELLARLEEAGGRPILLTGKGDAFSAGLDLKEVATLDGSTMLDFLRKLERVMTTLYCYPGPVVAWINGHAIAGGGILALCCDRRIASASPKIKIGLNEVALGVRFPPRILEIAKRRLPPGSIEKVLLGAGLFDPLTAQKLGLVDEVADDAEAVARAELAALAKNPAGAYATTKRDLRGTPESIVPDDVEEATLRAGVAAWTSPELKAKIQAMFAK